MKKRLSVTSIQKEHLNKEKQEEKERQISQILKILKEQAEYDGLRPAGSRKYRNWNEVVPAFSNQS